MNKNYIFRMMRLLTLFLFGGFLTVSAGSYSQTVTLKGKDLSLEEVFRAIREQTGYAVFGYTTMTKDSKPVSVSAQNMPLNEFLSMVMQDQPLVSRFEGRTIFLTRKTFAVVSTGADGTSTEQLASANQSSPPVIFRVFDSEGKPLRGATFSFSSSKNHATLGETDNNGRLSLNVSSGERLRVSFMGFEPFSFVVTDDIVKAGFFNINLTPGVSMLDETMVIAYGTTTQRYSTGSVSKVSSKEIGSQPITNPLQALEGRVPGLVVSQTNGVPGSSMNIQIRGQNSLNPNTTSSSTNFDNPLFIIDGVPFAPQNSNVNQFANMVAGSASIPPIAGSQGIGPFNSINPSDIESIEVLRDADATAIYGSRGANGVILITTKRGKVGKATGTINVWTGQSSVTRSKPMMNISQYLDMRNEALKNDGLTKSLDPNDPGYAPDLLLFDTTKNTDWRKYLMGGKANTTDINGSLYGGSNTTQFLVGAGYHQESYIYPGDFSDKRGSFNINVHHKSTDNKLSIEFSSNFSYDNNNQSSALDINTAFTLPPDFPNLTAKDGSIVFDYKGLDIGNYGAFGGNPLTYLKQPYSIKNYNLNSHFQVGYQILPGLDIRSSFGYNKFDANEFRAFPKSSQNPAYNPTAYSYFGKNSMESWIIEPQTEYKKKFRVGDLDILFGGTFQSNINKATAISAIGYINDDLIGSVSSAARTSASDSYSLYKYNGFFSRLNYIHLNRYVVNLTVRRDGSSRFGPGKQFGNFGAVGVGWIFSETRFVKQKASSISFGKIRASYGTTGNDNIGNYKYLSSYSPLPSTPYQGSTTYIPNNLFNSNFSWGVTKKLEAGLELGFFNDNLFLNTTGYLNKSGNQLVAYIQPTQTGFTSITRNAPYTVQNKGLEFSVSSTNIKSKNIIWKTFLNLTIPKNRLTRFPNISTSPYAQVYILGQSVNAQRRYVSKGVNDSSGLYQFQTQHGDLTSSPNYLLDRTKITNTDQRYYGGIRNTINFKGFELDIFFQFTKQTGFNYFNDLANSGYPVGYARNLPADAINRWRKPGDSFKFQKLSTQYGDEFNAGSKLFYSDAVLSDASFIRLKTFSLSYGVDEKTLVKLHLKTVRVYLNAQNLFTITGYEGNDPETQNFFSLPPLKTITAGVQIGL